jgi:hypothetical protein
MLPAISDVHVNKPLTNMSIGYTNLTYIADQIFPTMYVDKQTDIVPAYTQDYWFRDESALIAAGDVAPDVGYAVDTSESYYCHTYGLRHFIHDNMRANQDRPFDADRDATMLVTDKLMMRRERAFVGDFWTTNVWTTDVTGGSTVTKWSDFGASDPIVDIRTYKRTVRRLIGRDPNVLVLGDLVRDKLLDHPDVLDRIKYTQTGIASVDLLAAMFSLKKVLVGESIYTASAEGASSFTYSASWDDDALLLYVPDRPTLMDPAAGYTFVWRTGMQGGGMQWIRKYRDDPRRGDWVEVQSAYDQKLTSAGSGCFFDDISD